MIYEENGHGEDIPAQADGYHPEQTIERLRRLHILPGELGEHIRHVLDLALSRPAGAVEYDRWFTVAESGDQ